ncbi:MAG: tetratricopeptide repeat protein [Verrucomicrobiota bacterium]
MVRVCLVFFVLGMLLLESAMGQRRVVPQGGVTSGRAALNALWRNPVFQKELVGSYGIKADIEPGFTEEERVYHDEIVNLMQDDPDQAIAALKEITAIEGVSPRFEFLLGNVYFQEDEKALAIEHLLKAIDAFPTYREAHKILGTLYVDAERPRDAITHFTKAIGLGAASHVLYGLLGFAFVGTERFVEAESAFRMALILSPSGPQSTNWKQGLAQALYNQEKFDEMVSLMGNMIAEKPSERLLWEMQASAYLRDEQYLEAAKNYEMMDALGMGSPELSKQAALIYAQEGLYDLAADTYLRAYRNGTAGEVEGPLQAAEILMDREAMDQARRLLTEVRAMAGSDLEDKDMAKLLRLEAKMSETEGELEGARDLLVRVVDLDPIDGKSLIMLGGIYQALGEMEKAGFQYGRAANLEEFEAEAKTRHAELLVADGQFAEAIPLLKRAQEIDPKVAVGKFLEDLEDYVKRRR